MFGKPFTAFITITKHIIFCKQTKTDSLFDMKLNSKLKIIELRLKYY